jgi:predicted nuclease of predicted toxin-antitoxin system
VKVDEDLPKDVAAIFAAAGYATATVYGQGWSGFLDEALWPRVQAEGCWLLTADKAFGDIRTFVPGTHAGIILFRADDESRQRYLELAQATVRSLRLEDFPGCLIVVTPRGIRIRDWR